MKLVRDILAAKRADARPAVSFEFFPPKTPEGEKNFLEKTVPALAKLQPDFCSVTYGAGGTTKAKTLEIVDRIQCEHGLPAVAHLTCVGSTREEIRQIALQARSLDIRNLLALRGDPPAGQTEWTSVPGGFQFAHELVSFLKDIGGFSLGVAGFPEGHTACQEGREVDWDRLKAKVEAGADFVMTQLFFDNGHYLAMRDHLARRGVTVPIIPGIIPILSGSQIRKFTALCGAELPAAVLARLDELGDNEAAVAEFGIEWASKQCESLLREGAPGIHFYTLNKARSTTRILENLGLTGAAAR